MILMIIKLISLLKYGKSATHRNRQVPLTSRCVDNVCALQAAHLGRVRYLEHIHFSLCLDSSENETPGYHGHIIAVEEKVQYNYLLALVFNWSLVCNLRFTDAAYLQHFLFKYPQSNYKPHILMNRYFVHFYSCQT